MRTWSRTIRLLSKDAPHLFFGCVALLEAFSGGCLTTPRARIPADEDPSDPPTPSRQCGNAREWYAPLPWTVNLPLPILMLISHLSMFSPETKTHGAAEGFVRFIRGCAVASGSTSL